MERYVFQCFAPEKGEEFLNFLGQDDRAFLRIPNCGADGEFVVERLDHRGEK